MDTKKLIRELFSEPTGTLSWGRVASAVSLLAAIAWVTKVLLVSHVIPELSGITTFVLAPYGANKVATAVQAFSSNPTGSTPVVPVDKPEGQ